jgi:hypothetical protein
MFPIFFEDEVHHVVFSIMSEIDVDIRELVQHHAVAVEEPPEIQFEPDRANIGNAQAVTN